MNCHIRILRVEKDVKSYRTFKETNGVKDIDNEINETSLLKRLLLINEIACSTSYVPVPKVGKLPRHLTKSTCFPLELHQGISTYTRPNQTGDTAHNPHAVFPVSIFQLFHFTSALIPPHGRLLVLKSERRRRREQVAPLLDRVCCRFRYDGELESE